MSNSKKLKKQIKEITREFLKNKEDFQHDPKKLGLFSLKLKNCVIDVLQEIKIDRQDFNRNIFEFKKEVFKKIKQSKKFNQEEQREFIRKVTSNLDKMFKERYHIQKGGNGETEQDEFKEGSECPICMQPVEQSDWFHCPYVNTHGYHKDCINTWLNTSSTCPMCRRGINRNFLRTQLSQGRNNSSEQTDSYVTFGNLFDNMTHLNHGDVNHNLLFSMATFSIYLYASINDLIPLALIGTISNFIVSVIGRAMNIVERNTDEPHIGVNIFFMLQIVFFLLIFIINYSDYPIDDIRGLFTQVREQVREQFRQFQEINQTVIDNFVRELMGPHMEMDGGKPMPKIKTKSKKHNKRRVVKSNRKTRRKLR